MFTEHLTISSLNSLILIICLAYNKIMYYLQNILKYIVNFLTFLIKQWETLG